MDLPGKDEKTMSDMNTLLTSIRDAIATNATIKAWTQATYTKDHKVFVGVDSREPPGEADAPCVVLAPAEKLSGEEMDVITHKFITSLEVISPAATTASNVIEYAGVQNIETFRQKVLAAIEGVTGIRITKLESTYEAILFFPAILCDMLITIEQETEFGDDFVQ